MARSYKIPLGGLKDGVHSFEFEIGNEFFEEFEEGELTEGALSIEVEMEKRSTHADLNIIISGKVQICCDRCLDMFLHPIDTKTRLLVKFGKSIGEDDPDILCLPAGENEIDLKQHLYEFIMLALPIKRVHPVDSRGKSTCNPQMLEKLKELRADDETETDPRWDKLKRLINNN